MRNPAEKAPNIEWKGVKSDTFSTTTTSDGSAKLYNSSDRIIVGVKANLNCFGIFQYGTSWYVMAGHIVDGKYGPYTTGTSISGTYYYIDAT